MRTLRSGCCLAPRCEGPDEKFHQLLPEGLLIVVLHGMLLLVEDEGVVNGNIHQEPREAEKPLPAAPSDLVVRLALGEDIHSPHGPCVQRYYLRTRHSCALSTSPPFHRGTPLCV